MVTLATVNWSQMLATALGGIIAVIAAWLVDVRKARTEAKTRRRLARGSVRAWRDDLYRAEDVLGAAVKQRRWDLARLRPPLADSEDYKEVSREASWMTWGRLATAQHQLDRICREWTESRQLDSDEVHMLERLLLLVENARLRLARELDEDEPHPHEILGDPALRHLQESDCITLLDGDSFE